MGIFHRKPKTTVCDVCGKADVEGCGDAMKHVVKIRADQPAWLPAKLRSQAQGEFTWLCLRCDSYPAVKWPDEYGARAGLTIHLGKAHDLGEFRGVAHGMAKFEMIPAR